jgi:hypothetical protein
MELARTRWQAAAQAGMIVDVGGADLTVDRGAITMLKPGPVLVAATVAASWATVVGVVVDQGSDVRDPTKTRRILVDLSGIVAMAIKD